MKRFILFLLILIGAVWLGLKIHQDPGYLLLAYQYWTIEMPLWFAGILLVVIFLMLYALLRIISGTSSLGERIRAWFGRRRAHRSRSLTQRGLIDLMEGRWQMAEKKLIKAVESSDIPLINYLAAARGAQEQGQYERRDDYLRMAHHTTPEAEMAVRVVQAELQLNHQQFEYAVATLQHIRETVPQHSYVLKLLKECYVKLRDFKNLSKILPDLKKYKVLTPVEFDALQDDVYEKLFAGIKHHSDKRSLLAFWETVPKSVQRNSYFLNDYIEALIDCDASVEAESLIREALKREWDERLVGWYGCIQTEEKEKQLATAEMWLKTQPHNAVLLLTLGRLCIKNQLWGKARSYLESSISFSPSAEAYGELARLLEHHNEITLANEYYRKGLLLVVQN